MTKIFYLVIGLTLLGVAFTIYRFRLREYKSLWQWAWMTVYGSCIAMGFYCVLTGTITKYG